MATARDRTTSAGRAAGAAGPTARDVAAGRGLGGSGNGTNRGGMSTTLLDMKYPGAKNKKSRQYDLTAGNIAQVGTIMGSMVGGPLVGAAVAGYNAADAVINGTNPLSNALDPFTGRGPDVPSTGAGYADSGAKAKTEAMTPAEKIADQRTAIKKNKTKLSKGFTLLANAGGTLLGS